MSKQNKNCHKCGHDNKTGKLIVLTGCKEDGRHLWHERCFNELYQCPVCNKTCCCTNNKCIYQKTENRVEKNCKVYKNGRHCHCFCSWQRRKSKREIKDTSCDMNTIPKTMYLHKKTRILPTRVSRPQKFYSDDLDENDMFAELPFTSICKNKVSSDYDSSQVFGKHQDNINKTCLSGYTLSIVNEAHRELDALEKELENDHNEKDSIFCDITLDIIKTDLGIYITDKEFNYDFLKYFSSYIF